MFYKWQRPFTKGETAWPPHEAIVETVRDFRKWQKTAREFQSSRGSVAKKKKKTKKTYSTRPLIPPATHTIHVAFKYIHLNVSLVNQSGCALFRICPIPPTWARHFNYVDLFHLLVDNYEVWVISFTLRASFRR